MNLSILQKAGFTEGETQVYMSLLELGEVSTGPIIKQSGITGSKVYEILDKLTKKGLVSYVTREKTKYFIASSPKRILDYVSKKEDELKQQKEDIEKLIPALEKKRKSLQTPKSAQIFEGWQGLKTVFDLILDVCKITGEYSVISVGDDLDDKNVLLFFKNFHQKRINYKIKARLLANKYDRKKLIEWNSFKNIKLQFYSNPLPPGTFIFGDYVATISFGQKIAYVVKSEYVATHYQKFFDDVWKKSNK